MKGIIVRRKAIIVDIKNCDGDTDSITIALSENGKRLEIDHSDFHAQIKIKRLEYAIALAKAQWMAERFEDIGAQFASIWKQRQSRPSETLPGEVHASDRF